jgi:uncharacterized membrane protein YhiD involved in acid resistance
MTNPVVGSPEWKAQDKGPGILITCWVVTAIATLFVIARIYVRGKIQGRLRSDDWWVMAGLVSLVLFLVDLQTVFSSS